MKVSGRKEEKVKVKTQKESEKRGGLGAPRCSFPVRQFTSKTTRIVTKAGYDKTSASAGE